MKSFRSALRLVPLVSLLASAGLVGASGAAAEELSLAVKITDMQKNAEFKVMSAEEFKQLDAQIRLENRLFQKAQELAKKEWKADDTNKAPYPGGRLNPRKAEVMERGAREKVDKKVEKALKAEEKRQDDFKKPGGKLSEEEKKQANIKADKKRELETAGNLLKAKLDELIAKEKEAAEKPATP